MTHTLKAPFPYFGGKATVAPLVWPRFGDVGNYVEPFFGSGAILLARPQPAGTETVNDADGLVANFWRAVQHAPDDVARWADWPVNENDLHARHIWLVERKAALQSALEGDPEFFDTKIAGWWVWGMACWIGGGFCSSVGPWHVETIDGQKHLVNGGGSGKGVWRQRPHLGDAGRGVKRGTQRGNLVAWMHQLAERLERVRVCCGDWSRVCGPSVTVLHGTTAVFLDPPYSAEAGRDNEIYRIESQTVAHDARQWAIEQGADPRMRIALCGYEGEHAMPADWECVHWKAHGGMANLGNNRGKENRHRERIWFSPHCLRPEQRLFE